MDLERQLMELKKKVTNLEGQVQDRSAIEIFLNKLIAISAEASYTLSCNSRAVCECGHTQHAEDAKFCVNCGRELNRTPSGGETN